MAALEVKAPSGAVSLLLGSIHVPVDELCEPVASIMDGAKRYVVESFASHHVLNDETEAPASVLIPEPIESVDLPDLIKVLPRASWALELSDAQMAELDKRLSCAGFAKNAAEMLVRNESAKMAAALSWYMCAEPGLYSRDEWLSRAAAERDIRAYSLETQEEGNRQRDKIPERIHVASVYEALNDQALENIRRIVQALNSGKYDEIYRVVTEGWKDPEDGKLFLETMVVARNRAWLKRLAQYLDEGDAVINVGSGHLGGPEGLVALLSENGYELTEVRLPAAPREALFNPRGTVDPAGMEGAEMDESGGI